MSLTSFGIISIGYVTLGSALKSLVFHTLNMTSFEIRANIKFLTKLDWKPVKIMEALQQVYGDTVPCRAVIYDWIKRFKEGREQIEDDQREGRPSTSTSAENLQLVKELIKEDRRLTIDEIANEAGISHGSAFSIIKDKLGLSKLSARWVPKALQENEMIQRADLSLAILSKMEAAGDLFFKRCVTGDETWIYQYDPESKIQSKEWLPKGAAGPIKFKAERSVKKVMATIFWDEEGVILIDFLEGKKTVTASYYEEVLKKLKTAIIKKRRGKLHSQILFHHDNAPAHTSKVVRALLREFRWEILAHPPYSPDLAPSDFFLFPKLKEDLKGTRFTTLGEAKQHVITWCQKHPPEFYKEGLSRWKHRLQKCIDVNGCYVEK